MTKEDLMIDDIIKYLLKEGKREWALYIVKLDALLGVFAEEIDVLGLSTEIMNNFEKVMNKAIKEVPASAK